MSNDCNGCKCLTSFKPFGKPKMVCKFTQLIYDFIPGCPCKECLVKVICNSICADLVYMLKNRLEILEPYRSFVVGNSKDKDSGFQSSSSYSWGITTPTSWGITTPTIRSKRNSSLRQLSKMYSIKTKRLP